MKYLIWLLDVTSTNSAMCQLNFEFRILNWQLVIHLCIIPQVRISIIQTIGQSESTSTLRNLEFQLFIIYWRICLSGIGGGSIKNKSTEIQSTEKQLQMEEIHLHWQTLKVFLVFTYQTVICCHEIFSNFSAKNFLSRTEKAFKNYLIFTSSPSIVTFDFPLLHWRYLNLLTL